MFRLRRIRQSFLFSFSLLLLLAIGASGQVQKSPSSTQTGTDKMSSSLPQTEADIREASQVVVPSDPLIKLLRPIGSLIDQTPHIKGPTGSFFEGYDLLFLMFCGRNAISAEDFLAVQELWDSADAVKDSSPKPQSTTTQAERSASKASNVIRQ